MNAIHCNNVIRHALAVKFGRVFALSLTSFFTNGLGFDQAAFERALFNGGALEENVLRRYGDEGVTLVRKLTAAEPLSDDEKEEAAGTLGRYYVAAVCGFQERQLA
jgi:hypothetical protein